MINLLINQNISYDYQPIIQQCDQSVEYLKCPYIYAIYITTHFKYWLNLHNLGHTNASKLNLNNAFFIER